jgi:hypothetical protein
MRYPQLFAVVVLLNACDQGPAVSSTSAPNPPRSKEPAAIGPQFWKYELNEYSIVDNDVVSSLGGRWISVRYQRRPEHTSTRAGIVSRIATALQADGWKAAPLPQGKYVLSKIWDTSAEDLHFTRGAKADEPDHWSFAQTVFVSKEADTVAIYCEVGW